MCKNLLCESPKELICSDNRCLLTNTCRYISSCISKLISNTLQQYSCACNYTINSLQAYQLPDCVSPTTPPTTSPTNSPTTSPTLVPTNSSVMGQVNIDGEVKEEFNKMYYYIMAGVLFIIICLLIRFRMYVRKYFCCKKNRVDDEG